ERRQKRSVPTVALVGYTNAGKTTLFNRMTNETAVASDALFVTLDPLVRQVRLPDRRELLVSAAVRRVLDEVGANDVPTIDVYNKTDAMTADEQRRLRDADPACALISAKTGNGLDELLQMV